MKFRDRHNRRRVTNTAQNTINNVKIKLKIFFNKNTHIRQFEQNKKNNWRISLFIYIFLQDNCAKTVPLKSSDISRSLQSIIYSYMLYINRQNRRWQVERRLNGKGKSVKHSGKIRGTCFYITFKSIMNKKYGIHSQMTSPPPKKKKQ